MHFIDFHTHSPSAEPSSQRVISLRANTTFSIEGDGPFSIGIHPWDTSELDINKQLEKVKSFVEDNRIIAVGEIGLDRLKGSNLVTQTDIFKKQIEIAEKFGKPVVIHCVRCFSEIQQLRKQLKPKMTWAIHNFIGNAQIAKTLVQQGFYISFCIALAKNQKLCDALKVTPIDRIFFETDDFIDNVGDVYIAAANCLGVSVEKLQSQIEKNYNNFFFNP